MFPLEGWQVLLGAHVSPVGHTPQLSVPPQPSGMLPHAFAGQVFGVHELVTQTLAVQVWLLLQVPQLSVPPHPSGMVPQFLPSAAQLVGAHASAAWHVPPVQVSPIGQVQVIVPPQPLEIVPHALPRPPDPHVVGTHEGWQVPLADALHASPDPQAQLSVPPQPSGIVPHESPWLPAGQDLAVHPH
jgi:hypothetical protein